MIKTLITLALALALAVLGAAFAGQYSMRSACRADAALLAGEAQGAEGSTLDARAARRLPDAVRSHLKACKALGKPLPRFARARFEGQYLAKRDGSWRAVDAEAYWMGREPAMVWQASLGAWGIPLVSARDAVLRRQGSVTLKALGVFDMGETRGDGADQAGLVAWLSELPAFPGAMASPALRWQAEGPRAARVVLKAEGAPTAEGVFRFGKDGLAQSFEGLRARPAEGAAPEAYTVTYGAYREFGGVLAPASVEAGWGKGKKAWPCARLTLTEVEADRFASF